MDRTSEFLSIAQSLPPPRSVPTSSSSSTSAHSGGGGGKGVGAASARPGSSAKGGAGGGSANPAHAELRHFHSTAGEISRDIAGTSALLSELTNLVRHSSLFEDDTAKINLLVVRIKSSIENLNSRLDQLAVSMASQKRKLGNNSQAGQEAANVVDGLKTEFAQAASGFKKVLQQRTDNLKETEDRQRQIYGGGSASGSSPYDDDLDPIPNMSSVLSAPPPVYGSAPPSLSLGGGGIGAGAGMSAFPTLDLTSGLMPPGEATSSGAPTTLPRPHGIAGAAAGYGGLEAGSASNMSTIRHRTSAGGGAAATMYGRSHSVPLTPLDIQRMEEESGASQMMQLIPDHDYLRDRADAMSQVESNIVELGTIFNKLAVMVSEHRDLVQRVEDNVEEANANINLSLNALTDTLTSLRTNRMLALKVFSILVAFIVFFIIFAA
jgi:syntaxin 5